MNQQQSMTAGAEWRAHWPLVFSAMAGMSLGPVVAYSMGLFMGPLQAEFGWSRADVSSGLLVLSLIGTPLAPIAGELQDRWGARRLAIPGTLLTGLAMAAFAFANQPLAIWWGLWALFAFAGLVAGGAVWTGAVSSVFKAGRGLAIAIALCGVALSALGGPILSRWAIDTYGWRTAFVILGLGWGGLVLVIVVLFFHDAQSRRRRSMSQAELKTDAVASALALAALPGLTLKETLRRPVFWKLFVAQIVFITLVTALLIHMIPLLTGEGLSLTTAAFVVSAYGVASIVGKLILGGVLDRTRGPFAAGLAVGSMALACIVLLSGDVSVLTGTIAVAILGFSAGANLACGSYLTTRYMGLRAYGKIYSVIGSSLGIAAGLGPWIGGLVYDHFQGYDLLLTATIPLALLCGVLIASLGPYPEWPATANAEAG